MFIICPKCSAKYKIPDGITIDDGQKMKCSACGFVFFKGEEDPLILENSVCEQPVQKQPVAQSEPATEAFSKPLYTDESEGNRPIAPLPEAFQPVAPKKSRHAWTILLYICLIAAACAGGWFFRDFLAPSTYQSVPNSLAGANWHISHQAAPEKAVETSKPSPQKEVQIQSQQQAQPVKQHQAHRPAAPTPKQADKRHIIRRPEPVVPAIKEPVKPEPPLPEVPTPAIRYDSKPDVIENAVTPEPDIKEEAVEETAPAEMPVATEDPVDIVPDKPDIIPPAIETPMLPEAFADFREKQELPSFDDEVEIPLLEEVSESAKEPATENGKLTIDNVSFRTEPDLTGTLQLLIEGRVLNETNVDQPVGLLKLVVRNQLGEQVAQKNIHVDADTLSPRGSVLFYTGIVPAPSEASRIEVTIAGE